MRLSSKHFVHFDELNEVLSNRKYRSIFVYFICIILIQKLQLRGIVLSAVSLFYRLKMKESNIQTFLSHYKMSLADGIDDTSQAFSESFISPLLCGLLTLIKRAF